MRDALGGECLSWLIVLTVPAAHPRRGQPVGELPLG